MQFTKSKIFHIDSIKPKNPETEQGNIQLKLISHEQSTKTRKTGEGGLKSEAYKTEQA